MFTAIIYSIFLVVKAIVLGVEVPGYITTIILIVLFGGAQLVALGVLGEYISRIFEQVKGRPLYVVDEVVRWREHNDFSNSL